MIFLVESVAEGLDGVGFVAAGPLDRRGFWRERLVGSALVVAFGRSEGIGLVVFGRVSRFGGEV